MSYTDLLSLLGMRAGARLYFTLATLTRQEYTCWAQDSENYASLDCGYIMVRDQAGWASFLELLRDRMNSSGENKDRRVGVNVE